MKVVTLGGGRHMIPTGLWLSARGRSGAFEGSIEKPSQVAHFLEDLKGWAIDGREDTRELIIDGQRVHVTLEKVLHEFMRRLFNRARLTDAEGHDFWFLLPSDHDHDIKLEYQQRLRKAAENYLPDGARVRFYSEADATAEYFRLVQGRLRLRKGRNDAVLIVDCGALTCNLTLAFSTRKANFGDVETGAGNRRGPLAAVESATIRDRSGRHLDRIIWAEITQQLGDASEAIGESDGLRVAERLKVLASQSPGGATLRGPGGERVTLTRARLEQLSYELWEREYEATLEQLLQRAYKQLHESERYRALLEEEHVTGPQDMGRMLSAVILAGGTSRLPGFEEALFTLIPTREEIPVLRPGPVYPGVPALGALARVLEHRGALEIIRPTSEPPDGREDASAVEYLPFLEDDIYLHCSSNGAKKSLVKVIDAEDALAMQGEERKVRLPRDMLGGGVYWLTFGNRPEDRLQSNEPYVRLAKLDGEVTVSARLIHPHGREGATTLIVKIGSGKQEKILRASPDVDWQPDETNAPIAVLEPASVGGARLSVKPSNVVVIDIGMSKSLVVRPLEACTVSESDFAFLESEVNDYLPPQGWSLTPGLSDVNGAGASATPPSGGPREGGPPEPLEEPDNGEFASARGVDGGKDAIPTPPVPPPAPEPPSGDPEPEVQEGSDVVVETSSAEHPDPESVRPGPPAPLPITPQVNLPETEHEDELHFLLDARRRLSDAGMDLSLMDLATLHIALKIRPLVLLAGPPGAGKTTLARSYARALGMLPQAGTFAHVAVEADWVHDRALLDDGGPLRVMLKHAEREGEDLLYGMLLDEFNLTRPEYYLGRVLSAMESGGGVSGSLALPRTEAGRYRFMFFGTLNIDECSRPPSDKVLDRAFLLEVSPRLTAPPARLRRLASSAPAERRVTTRLWQRWCDAPESIEVPQELQDLMVTFLDARSLGNPHEDLTPSRRSLIDIAEFMYYYERLNLHDHGFSRADAIDRAVAARILPRVRGEWSAVSGLLEGLERAFSPGDGVRWTLCRERVTALRRQERRGFVSYWG